MVPFYDPRVFERLNVALLDLFDRIEVNRYKPNPVTGAYEIHKIIRVPVTFHYSKNFADFVLNTQSKPESKHTTPILGLRMGTMARNVDGITARTFTREIYDPVKKQVVQDMRPAPWKMTYTLTSYTENIYDHFQIMENIVPYFNPVFNTTIREFEFSNLNRNIIIELTGVSPQYNDNVEREKANTYICDYTFDVKFDMYAPFYIGTLVEQINNNISANNLPIEKIQTVQLEDMNIDYYNEVMRVANEVTSAGTNENSTITSSVESVNQRRIRVDVTDQPVVHMIELPAGAKVYHSEILVNPVFNDATASVSIGIDSNREYIHSRNESNLSMSARYQQEHSTSDVPALTSNQMVNVYFDKAASTVGSLEAIIKWII